MDKTIVAYFDTVDAAEFGARSVKNSINNVKEIKIKYQTNPGVSSEPVFGSYFAPTSLETPLLINGTIPPVIDAHEIGRDVVSLNDDDYVSIYKAKLVAKVDELQANNAIAKMRANGGYNIKTI